jgi:hypothetical protein
MTPLACRSGTDRQTGAHTFGSDPRGWPGTTSTGSCTGSSGVRPRKPRPSTTLDSAPESTPVTRNEVCIKPGMLHRYRAYSALATRRVRTFPMVATNRCNGPRPVGDSPTDIRSS